MWRQTTKFASRDNILTQYHPFIKIIIPSILWDRNVNQTTSRHKFGQELGEKTRPQTTSTWKLCII